MQFHNGMVAVRLTPDLFAPDAASTFDVKNSTFLLDSRAAAFMARFACISSAVMTTVSRLPPRSMLRVALAGGELPVTMNL